jgi:NADPH-dependent curcumin reductase CurA
MAAFPVTSILWKGHVEDGPVPKSNFVVSEGGSISAEQLQDGEALVALLFLSVDPYMRGRMREMKVGC